MVSGFWILVSGSWISVGGIWTLAFKFHSPKFKIHETLHYRFVIFLDVMLSWYKIQVKLLQQNLQYHKESSILLTYLPRPLGLDLVHQGLKWWPFWTKTLNFKVFLSILFASRSSILISLTFLESNCSSEEVLSLFRPQSATLWVVINRDICLQWSRKVTVKSHEYFFFFWSIKSSSHFKRSIGP